MDIKYQRNYSSRAFHEVLTRPNPLRNERVIASRIFLRRINLVPLDHPPIIVSSDFCRKSFHFLSPRRTAPVQLLAAVLPFSSQLREIQVMLIKDKLKYELRAFQNDQDHLIPLRNDRFIAVQSKAAEKPGSSIQKFDLSSHDILIFRNVMVKEYVRTGDSQLDMLLWKEGSGRANKGWVDEQFLNTAKPRAQVFASEKRMYNQGHNDWLVEMDYLGQVGHVKLTGYNFHINNSYLKYEFYPKGSLDTHMLTSWHQSPAWSTRIKVAVGAARALTLLHDLEMPTMEDGNSKAKLWDIGLAIKGPFSVINQVGATIGPYAAPEYIASGNLSAEGDVYSFGVVLIELISGRRALERRLPSKYLMDWVKPYLGVKKSLWMIMDRRLNGQYPQEEAYKVGKIALQCVSSDPTSRPTMAEVVAALQQLLSF